MHPPPRRQPPFLETLPAYPTVCAAGLSLCFLGCLSLTAVRAADVVGYSVLKGQFFNQWTAEEIVLDPDFGYSFLASVDLVDFELLKSASLRLPEGESIEMGDFGDYASLLDSFENFARLNRNYTWGDYLLLFTTVNDGSFSCLVALPESPLPPAPRLTNFEVIQTVDPRKSLELKWAFDGPTDLEDFVQIYINLGHVEVYSTPNFGEPGALTAASRTITLPAGTLHPRLIYSLNLEITRIISSTAECYPDLEGVGGLFRSTSLYLATAAPPRIRLLGAPASGAATIEVVGTPDSLLVLERSSDFGSWSPIATNRASNGTNVFMVPTNTDSSPRFFRALER